MKGLFRIHESLTKNLSSISAVLGDISATSRVDFFFHFHEFKFQGVFPGKEGGIPKRSRGRGSLELESQYFQNIL